jgi:hypothetical protein
MCNSPRHLRSLPWALDGCAQVFKGTDITYPEAVLLRIMLRRRLGETPFGVFDRNLVESA